MHKPTISIIMPVYNGQKYIEESIDSIIGQTFSDFELIIIDDSSTDDSKKIALDYVAKDQRIKVIENTYDKGLYGALNSGLDACTGEYIARADADDINRPYRLKTQISFLKENKTIDIVGGGYQLFGNGTYQKIFHPSKSLRLAWKFLTNTYFCHPSVMFRKSVLATVPRYPNVVCEDFAFFSKIIQTHKGHNIRKILIDYRQHDSNYSNTQSENIQKSIKNTYLHNFEFYTGSFEHAEVFYQFHYFKKVAVKDTFKIIKISFVISQKILKQYGFRAYGIRALYLYSVMKLDICLALALNFFRKI